MGLESVYDTRNLGKLLQGNRHYLQARKIKKDIIRDVLVNEVLGGDEGDRTPDLMNAIHALSQLSYVPGIN